MIKQTIFFLVGGLILTSTIDFISKKSKGDERVKEVAKLSGFATWYTLVAVTGLDCLQLVTGVNIPRFHPNDLISKPVLFVLLLLIYAAFYIYYYIRKS